jgi:alkanesulfonate monooxygenase SsuD/methylene tetrahydromethanopterin reductase-like flavin-dependent oxidoreductase (luciferase family)
VTAFRRLPDMTTGPRRPYLVGGVGVGVASAAISLGAVYVAWRYSHPASGRMGRAVRAAHGRSSHSGRRSGVINGIRGVVS